MKVTNNDRGIWSEPSLKWSPTRGKSPHKISSATTHRFSSYTESTSSPSSMYFYGYCCPYDSKQHMYFENLWVVADKILNRFFPRVGLHFELSAGRIPYLLIVTACDAIAVGLLRSCYIRRTSHRLHCHSGDEPKRLMGTASQGHVEFWLFAIGLLLTKLLMSARKFQNNGSGAERLP